MHARVCTHSHFFFFKFRRRLCDARGSRKLHYGDSEKRKKDSSKKKLLEDWRKGEEKRKKGGSRKNCYASR